jgi:hypothetical protein
MTEWATDWALILLVMEGIPLLAFIYYLDYKKKLRLMDKEIPKEETSEVRMERRLISGLFLSLAGISLIVSPNLSWLAGVEASLTFEMLVLGIVILSSGLAMLLGYGIMRGKAGYSESDDLLQFK